VTERELEFYKDGTDELQSYLGKSLKSNTALITFIYQILVDRVYPTECDWSHLKGQDEEGQRSAVASVRNSS
jgi:hypothetical protein